MEDAGASGHIWASILEHQGKEVAQTGQEILSCEHYNFQLPYYLTFYGQVTFFWASIKKKKSVIKLPKWTSTCSNK